MLAITLLAGLSSGYLLRLWWTPDLQTERSIALNLANAHHLEAEPLLTNLLKQNPKDIEILKALVVLQMVADRPQEADEYLARWCKLEPDNPTPLTTRFELSARLFRYQTAVACGRKLLQQDPALSAVRRKLMWIEVRTGQLEEAIKDAEDGLSQQPKETDYLHLLAHVSHLQGEWDAANKHLDDLFAQSEHFLPAILLRGTILCETNQFQQAIPYLDRVIRDDPLPENQQKARYQLAQAFYRLGRTREADEQMAIWQRHENALRTVIDAYQQPSNFDLRLQAGKLLLETGQTARGIAVLKDLLSQDPNQAEARRLLENQIRK